MEICEDISEGEDILDMGDIFRKARTSFGKRGHCVESGSYKARAFFKKVTRVFFLFLENEDFLGMWENVWKEKTIFYKLRFVQNVDKTFIQKESIGTH